MATFGGLTAVLHGVEDLRLEQHPHPTPNTNDVLIQVKSVGICGSDLSYYFKCEIGGHHFQFPQVNEMRFAGVMGHEASGVVTAVGSAVSHLQVGDRVVMEPGVPCMSCRDCTGGRYNLCANLRFLGSFLSNQSGALCEYITHPSNWCYRLPENISFDQAALVEPLAVAIQAVKRGRVTLGDKVLITGAGPVGILSLVAAKANGASHVSLVDINPERLGFAKQTFGANNTFLLPQDSDAIPNDYTVTIECSGVNSSLQLGINHTRRGGRLVLVGTGTLQAELRYAQLRELDIMGVFRYCGTFGDALELVSRVEALKQLVTHHFELKDVNAAFHAAKYDPNTIKVLIHPTQ